MLKLLRYLKPYLSSVAIIFVSIAVQVYATLQLPDYMAKIINQGIILQDNNLIIRIGLEMLGITLVGAVGAIVAGFLASRVATAFARDIRSILFTRVENFSLVEFNKFSTASLITRSTNDIQQIQMVMVMMLRLVLMAPMMGIGAIIQAYQTAPSMSWIMALAVGIMILVILLLFSLAIKRFQKLQKLVDKLNLVSRQILTGIRVIRAFNTERYEEKKFDDVNTELTGLSLFLNRLMVVIQPFMMLITNLTAVFVVWIGAHLVSTSDLQIGNMIAFMQYAMQVLFAFLMISIIFIMLPRAAVSAQRASEVIDTEPLINDPSDPVDFPKDAKGTVEFKNVYFAYPDADEPILYDLSFVASPGETTAFVGSTGSGKSTVINLIPRFFDVTEGQILVDGVDIRTVTQKALRDRIGFVPQKGVVFSGTVESNIKFGAEHISQAETEKAAATAQATEFIDQLADGFAGSIAQGGTNVSGGQKQRLAIARALATQPEIYIFDDSFSALDFATDAALRKELAKQTKSSTVLIVAQRISTIMDADKIVVLDKGKIVGIGKHAELLKSCSVYREIALSQLSEEELGRAKI